MKLYYCRVRTFLFVNKEYHNINRYCDTALHHFLIEIKFIWQEFTYEEVEKAEKKLEYFKCAL